MILLSRRAILAVAAVVDIALHARPAPVAAKALAGRHQLPPRHLETLLQTLVHANILKGVRGPRGGYELARERRRITVGEVVRAAMSDGFEGADGRSRSPIVEKVIVPMVSEASRELLDVLDQLTIEELCKRAEAASSAGDTRNMLDFTI